MKLYSYWRSTTSVRVRAALNLKGVPYDIVPVDLVRGEQKAESYATLNPAKGVPTLVLDDGTTLTQSMAILDYIDTVYPEPPLYPADPVQRAQVDAAAHAIALDIHPVNNLRVLGHLKGTMGHSQDEAEAWMRHWMHEGFAAFQTLIRADTPFCFGDAIGMAQLVALKGSDSAPVVRLPMGEAWAIKQVLDAGAQTLLIPLVESAGQARDLVRAMGRAHAHIATRAVAAGVSGDHHRRHLWRHLFPDRGCGSLRALCHHPGNGRVPGNELSEPV